MPIGTPGGRRVASWRISRGPGLRGPGPVALASGLRGRYCRAECHQSYEIRPATSRHGAGAVAVLRSKVNPNNTTHHLSLVEADQLIGLTGDHRMLHDLAQAHGYVLQAMPAEVQDDATVMELVLDLHAANGEFARELHDALADEIITGNEMSELAKDCHGSMHAAVLLLRKLREMSKARSVRHG
ncbi:hypothetical protein EA662_17505 [Pseudoxanthomonas winnipegensis]|uniref:phage regulatory CII family protein n=1 Tax=Pseudoxanthomonas winnipegensis TaxID=2480810 RepID=UPI00102E0233|nr:phage regulatory CII family protein [Pseudoxanthomonas winnipegensis]RZZ81965.1 hypothetical protein EA662_17505 [Pseudoxanthomonas winnipegensis]